MARKRGFTLIELLIALAVTATLALLAFHGVQDIVRKSRRSDAIAALLKLQLAQERLRGRCPSYAQEIGHSDACGANPADTGVSGSRSSPEGFYDISIKAATASRDGYVALAIPTAMQADDGCGIFAIDQNGPLYTHGADRYADAACWRR